MALINHWREFRERRGWSMEDTANKLGISRQMLSKIELNQAHTTTRIIERACRLYGCQPSDLYFAEHEIASPAAP